MTLLAGRVALITGGSRGIGRAIAERFVREGASVVLVSRSAEVDTVATELQAGGATATAVRGDITNPDTAKMCLGVVRREHGGLHILVNNAGIMPLGVLGMIRADDMRAMFEINVVAAITLTQLAVRAMKPGASIINVSSIAREGIAGASVYSATKGAIASFTMAAAKELAPRGIRVNALAPGFIDTDLTRETSDAVRVRTVERISLQRMGRADEVAAAALFLASDLSSYVTGHVLAVDGGMGV